VKVFLDVGAHEGETVRAVRDPKYAFDRIVCFEPAPACWPALDAIGDTRVVVCRHGLWDRTGAFPLYDPGSSGASLFEGKFHRSPGAVTCRFVRASDWFCEHLPPGAEIYVKLNCEGAECDIVDDLLASGELRRVRSVVIDFDVRKIPALKHRERELRQRLAEAGLGNHALADDVMVGRTHRDRIQHWLRAAGAEEHAPVVRARQLGYVVQEAARGHREPLRRALGS
jgi:FkbM family methyltransferase